MIRIVTLSYFRPSKNHFLPGGNVSRGKCSVSGPTFYLVSGYKYNDSETSENSETADFLIYDPQRENFKCWSLKNSVVVNAIYRSTLSTSAEKADTLPLPGGHALLHTLPTNQWNCSEYWKIEEVVYTIVSTVCPGKQVFVLQNSKMDYFALHTIASQMSMNYVSFSFCCI